MAAAISCHQQYLSSAVSYSSRSPYAFGPAGIALEFVVMVGYPADVHLVGHAVSAIRLAGLFS